jgi:hypothetical protein
MKIKRVAAGVDVAPLLWALQANAHLWNEHTQRTQDPASPHHEVDDIWCRYAAPEVAILPGPHESVWYPGASLLPVKEIVFPLMQFVQGERLGGVLITRIRAGKQCKPHKDDGWHARYYEKFAVQVQSAPGQRFCFDGESLEARPGDVYWFDNAHTHWVENPTEHDRITMVVCIRMDKGATSCRGQ